MRPSGEKSIVRWYRHSFFRDHGGKPSRRRVAGPLGIDTVILAAGKPGGTCLTVGCIPSKALIHAAEEFDATRKMLAETSDGRRETLPANRILVTVGRRPRTEGSGLEELELDRAGPYLRIDDRCRTSMRGIYAIGDVTGEPMLAHRAMAQGEMVAEIIAGKKRAWDKRCIPAICFTDPEIVSAGLTPAEARAQGYEIRTGQFPFSANGRAMTMLSEEGFVGVVARADTNLVLGLQAVGAGVSELSAAFALAIEMGVRLEDIAGTIHAHPTRSEAVMEAALKALGSALHI